METHNQLESAQNFCYRIETDGDSNDEPWIVTKKMNESVNREHDYTRRLDNEADDWNRSLLNSEINTLYSDWNRGNWE